MIENVIRSPEDQNKKMKIAVKSRRKAPANIVCEEKIKFANKWRLFILYIYCFLQYLYLFVLSSINFLGEDFTNMKI